MDIDYVANSVLTPYKWDKTEITYSFKSEKLYYESYSDFKGSTTISNAMKLATEEIFNYLESFLGLKFTLSTGIGDIVLSSKYMSEENVLGYSYLPTTSSTYTIAGDVYINANFTEDDFKVGGLGWSTILHELGHSLGLDHPFGDGYYSSIDMHETVMSYNPYEGEDLTGYYFFANSFSTYMSADIEALQSKYGENDTISNDYYDLNELLFTKIIYGYFDRVEDDIYTLNDTGGIDTISLKNIQSSSEQYIDLNPLAESIIVNGDIHHYFFLSQDTMIENFLGSNSDDVIILNSTNNFTDLGLGFDRVYIENNGSSRIDFFNGKLVVSNKESGLDTISNAEEIFLNNEIIDEQNFQRDVIHVDNYEAGTQISRLYLGVFDRVADKEGLYYWINEYENLNDISLIANSFVISQEFNNIYGSTQTDQEYVSLLYNNILYREPDQDGFEYWISKMQDENFSKSNVLVSFSNSQEFINLTAVYFEDDSIVVL